MARGWLKRVRVFINSLNLALSLLFIAGAAWAIAQDAPPAEASLLGRLYGPVLGAYSWYWSQGLAAKALVALAAALAVAVLLVALLFAFKLHAEDWAIVVLGIPFYLLLASAAFLSLGIVISLIRKAV